MLSLNRFISLGLALGSLSVLGCSSGVTLVTSSGGSSPTGGASASGGSMASGGALVTNSGGATSGGSVSASGGQTSGGASSSGGADSGGSAAGGTAGGTGGSDTSTGGADSGGGTGGTANPGSGLGSGTQSGQGTSSKQYETVTTIQRNGVPYVLITNGWGPGFQSHTISWLGTSFTVDAMQGTAGSGGQPASYPTVFCGKYSVAQVPACGLPAEMTQLKSLKTGWRWSSNGNDNGEYNAAYDIWVGNGTQLQGYLMVWLRDPKSYQPAGAKTTHLGVTVEGLPGTWDIWSGKVNNLPITNWVRAENDQISEIEFDVLDVLKDAQMRGITYPGTHINSVAVGFEIWEGPISGLKTDDFYVEVE